MTILAGKYSVFPKQATYGAIKGSASGTTFASNKDMFRLLILLLSICVSRLGVSYAGSADPFIATNLSDPVIAKLVLQGFTNNLRAQGVTKLGDLDFNELEQKIGQVKLGLTDGDVILGSEQRDTAIYLAEEKQTVLNNGLRGTDSTHQPVVILHELLGGAGYDDDKYQLSTTLNLLNSKAAIEQELYKRPEINEIFKNLSKTDKNRTYDLKPKLPKKDIKDGIQILNKSGGGITGVGGGGDRYAIVAKIYLQSAIAKKTAGTDSWANVAAVAADLDIESFFDEEMQPIVFYDDGNIFINRFHIDKSGYDSIVAQLTSYTFKLSKSDSN